MREPKAPKLVTIAVMTSISVIFWVFFSVYRILTAETEPLVSEEILAPIDPTLDQTTLNSLEDRIFFDDSQILSPQIFLPVQENETIEPEIEVVPETVDELVDNQDSLDNQ